MEPSRRRGAVPQHSMGKRVQSTGIALMGWLRDGCNGFPVIQEYAQ